MFLLLHDSVTASETAIPVIRRSLILHYFLLCWVGSLVMPTRFTFYYVSWTTIFMFTSEKQISSNTTLLLESSGVSFDSSISHADYIYSPFVPAAIASPRSSTIGIFGHHCDLIGAFLQKFHSSYGSCSLQIFSLFSQYTWEH